VACGKGTDGQCSWAPVSGPKYAERPEAAGAGELCLIAALGSTLTFKANASTESTVAVAFTMLKDSCHVSGVPKIPS
jgi:hypothetical protein